MLRKQGKDCDSHTSSTECTYFAGDPVWAMNFAGTTKWQPGELEEETGPRSHTVRLADGRCSAYIFPALETFRLTFLRF